MSSTVRFISCVSSHDRQKSVVRSLLSIIGQSAAANLRTQWVYRDDGPSDVMVVDIDDHAGQHFLGTGSEILIVALGSNRAALDDHDYALTKPLRWQELMQILHTLEQKHLRVPTPPVPVSGHASPVRAAAAPAPSAAPVESVHAPAYRLKAWPDLTRMRDETLQDAARICALLAKRPCTIGEISRTLELPELRINRLLDSIRHAAHPDWECLGDAEARSSAAATAPIGKPSSFLSKMWNRLRGGA